MSNNLLRSIPGPGKDRSMQKLFSVKINAFLAILLVVLFSLTSGVGAWLAARAAARIPPEQETSRGGSSGEDAVDDFRPVYEAREYIEAYFVGNMDEYSPVESAVNGMVEGLGDRWSYYVSPAEMEAYYENLTNSYVGIGVTVSTLEDGTLKVESVNEDGGAWDAGIRIGDVIVGVNGVMIAEAGEERDYWVSQIRGKEGTTVELTVLSGSETRVLTVERRTVHTVIVTSARYGDVGYVALKNFNQGSADAFIKATKALIADGVRGLVFDMRFNGGGRLSELVKILDYLLPEGQIFRMVDKAGEETVYNSDAKCVDLPMAVLINDSSYSAAEYFAAALQQYGVAVTVGGATVGKGFAQNTYMLSDGSAIAISIFQYFTPNGQSLAGVGLTPDYALDLSTEDYAELYYGRLAPENDQQLQKALEVVLAAPAENAA